jgi:hypothetical protein
LAVLTTQRSRSLIENELRVQQKKGIVTTQPDEKVKEQAKVETVENKEVKQAEQTNQKDIVPEKTSPESK